MLEEVYKLIRYQDQNGELFGPKYLIKEPIHEESFQEEEYLDEVQHPNEKKETLVTVLPLDEDEVFQPCFPPAHEVEEVISLNDEEFEDPVEAPLAFVLLAHKEKEMFIFSHADSLMKEPLDMVDKHIETFIQTGTCRWDFGRFIFYRDPIYDTNGSSQEKGVELSSSEDWSSCMYDSDAWQPDNDMVTNLFLPFEDDLLQHFKGDFQSSLGRCVAHPFGDADFLYENF